MQVAKDVKAAMKNISKDFPEGLSYEIPFDITTYIAESVHEVYKTLFEALVWPTIRLFSGTPGFSCPYLAGGARHTWRDSKSMPQPTKSIPTRQSSRQTAGRALAKYGQEKPGVPENKRMVGQGQSHLYGLGGKGGLFAS